MVRRVVPLVLRRVKLARLADRPPYIRFWRQHKDELRELAASLGDSLGRSSWEEMRLTAEFAHHVDDILRFFSDVLMPCDLGDVPGKRFEPLLEAVRARTA